MVVDGITNAYDNFNNASAYYKYRQLGNLTGTIGLGYVTGKVSSSVLSGLNSSRVGTNTVLSNSSQIATRSEQVVYNHGYKYAKRIRDRAMEDPVAHNFLYSFDDEILKGIPIIQKDRSLLFRFPGTMNKTSGFFDIAVNPKTNLIYHRTFVSREKVALFLGGNKMRYLTLSSDFTGSCIKDDFEGEINLQELNLPNSFIIELNNWHDSYKTIIPLSEEERKDKNKIIEELDTQGLILANKLKETMNDKIKIKYFSEGKLTYLPVIGF